MNNNLKKVAFIDMSSENPNKDYLLNYSKDFNDKRITRKNILETPDEGWSFGKKESEEKDERLLSKKRILTIKKKDEYYNNSDFKVSIYNLSYSNAEDLCTSIKKINQRVIKLSPENSGQKIFDKDNLLKNKKLKFDFSSNKKDDYSNSLKECYHSEISFGDRNKVGESTVNINDNQVIPGLEKSIFY